MAVGLGDFKAAGLLVGGALYPFCLLLGLKRPRTCADWLVVGARSWG